MNPPQRPNPDNLLARLNAEESSARRGRLRIFFGASAGVGKTFAMLEAAHNLRAAGKEVVVGYIEPHGRPETERLLEGLERLPPVRVSYRGMVRDEFDLDGALRRAPAVVLVDELAHSNLVDGDPPSRHPKRWQDIEELLAAGIGVWTTVNVQHLESLNDLIEQTSGIRQRETIPDQVFDEADEVELIDVPPEDLIARLQAGKIYVADQAAVAVERFFRRPNLLALREMALRRVADRVEAAARAALPSERGRRRLAGDRVLVAIGPDEQAEQLVRAGKRMADALDAGWTVVYVETPALLRLSESERDRRVRLLRLAESLGAETVTLDGPSAASALLEYARTRHATRLLVGAPKRHGWRTLLRRSAARQLIGQAEGLEITVVTPDVRAPAAGARSAQQVLESRSAVPWARYGWALVTTAACSAVCFAMYAHLELVNLAMVYLLGVVIAGLRFGRGPSVLTSVANVIVFDFCFVPPRFSLAVSDVQYLFTFLVMLTVALVIATLVASVRQQTRVAGARERRTAMLYAMSRELAASRGVSAMAEVAVRHVAEVFQCRAALLLPDVTGRLSQPRDPPLQQSFRGADLAVAQWVADHGQPAGIGTDTLPAAPGLYMPLGDARRRLGVLAVLPNSPRRVMLPEQRHLLETFAGQIGLGIERARLAERAETARVAAEGESVRNTLLASISHDLRTPLAVITGASSTLSERGEVLDAGTRNRLARSIETKAREMAELISNVLDLTRFEAGRIDLRRDWETLDDLVGSALEMMEGRLVGHPVEVALAQDLPAVHVDARLVVQLLANLLDNAAKYTPAGTPIRITALVDGEHLRVQLDDAGPGLPAGDPERLFNKFQRGNEEGSVVGAGLGLAICRTIARAHGGDIEAIRLPGGGTRFEFTLPLAASAATAQQP